MCALGRHFFTDFSFVLSDFAICFSHIWSWTSDIGLVGCFLTLSCSAVIKISRPIKMFWTSLKVATALCLCPNVPVIWYISAEKQHLVCILDCLFLLTTQNNYQCSFNEKTCRPSSWWIRNKSEIQKWKHQPFLRLTCEAKVNIYLPAENWCFGRSRSCILLMRKSLGWSSRTKVDFLYLWGVCYHQIHTQTLINCPITASKLSE